tara:strand:+ start:29 stop:859 length:831 start_codon:yes stop_codon:yes gene_type:complete
MNDLTKGLYIVSTPIGNLEDITIRAINVLKNSDLILCEDTRQTLKLLNTYKIKNKLISYHKFNEKKSISNIIKYLNEGKILSLVSDAGTPVISDPGKILINECIKNGNNIFAVPGPSSVIAAASLSGFSSEFVFQGFLPKKESGINESLKNLRNINYTLIFFAPANKVNVYLKYFKKFFSDRKIFIAREMTKKHETHYRDNVDKIQLFKNEIKGELTIVISKKNNKTEDLIDYKYLEKQIKEYLKRYKVKDVVELMSSKEKISKKIIYKLCLKNKR